MIFILSSLANKPGLPENLRQILAIGIAGIAFIALWELCKHIPARARILARYAFFGSLLLCQEASLRFLALIFRGLDRLSCKNRLLMALCWPWLALLSFGLMLSYAIERSLARAMRKLKKGNWLCKLILGILIIALALMIFSWMSYLLIPILALGALEAGLRRKFGISL
jgi:hypothetical protein